MITSSNFELNKIISFFLKKKGIVFWKTEIRNFSIKKKKCVVLKFINFFFLKVSASVVRFRSFSL